MSSNTREPSDQQGTHHDPVAALGINDATGLCGIFQRLIHGGAENSETPCQKPVASSCE